MDAFRIDLRWSVRSLRKRPTASLAVVTILASAIAAATVLGGLFAAIIDDPPPVDSPDTIVHVWRADDSRPAGHREPSAADFLDWKRSAQTLTALTAWVGREAIVGGADGQTVDVLLVTVEYFHLAGRQPRLGRAFVPRDFERADVAIVSDRLWRERFNNDPAVVGRRLFIDAQPREIVGVMPADFWFPFRGVDVWQPFQLEANAAIVDVAGRLVPNVAVAQAQSEFDVLALRTAGIAATARNGRSLLRSFPAEARVKIGPALQGLVAPAFVILLIACANVGNLLLIRMIARERELAIRTALGATAARLARLSLVETAVLATAAGLVGLLFAIWATRALQLAMASAMPAFTGAVRVGPRVVVIAGLATLVTLVSAGLLPAFSALRRDVAASISGRSRRPILPRFQYNLGDVLVVAQVGLAVVLVLVSALLIRFFVEFDRTMRPVGDPNVRVTRIVTPSDMELTARATIYEEIREHAAATQGIDAAALTTQPFGARTRIVAASSLGSAECNAAVAFVSPTYFETLGLPLHRGTVPRTAIAGEGVVISAHAASACWGDASPHEWRMRLASGPSISWMPVLAVAADPFVRPRGLKEELPPFAWVIGTRSWPRDVYLLVKPHAGTVVQATTLGIAVGLTASERIAVDRFTTLAERIGAARQLASAHLILKILGAVAILALVLAFTGVYAAFAQSCSVRLVELGIRLALGATPRRLVAAAVGRDVPLVVLGIASGLIGTLWVTRIVWPDLLAISAVDPRLWMAVCGILSIAALVASVGPALRAIRVDPVTVLSAE